VRAKEGEKSAAWIGIVYSSVRGSLKVAKRPGSSFTGKTSSHKYQKEVVRGGMESARKGNPSNKKGNTIGGKHQSDPERGFRKAAGQPAFVKKGKVTSLMGPRMKTGLEKVDRGEEREPEVKGQTCRDCRLGSGGRGGREKISRKYQGVSIGRSLTGGGAFSRKA